MSGSSRCYLMSRWSSQTNSLTLPLCHQEANSLSSSSRHYFLETVPRFGATTKVMYQRDPLNQIILFDVMQGKSMLGVLINS